MTSDYGQKRYGSDIKLTCRPDMFTLEDEPGGQRTEMPCGHVVGPDSLTEYCRSVLQDGKFDFRCPYKHDHSATSCNALWDFPTVKKYALLTDAEAAEFEAKRKTNYLSRKGVPQCPVCFEFTSPVTLDKKIECSHCPSKYERSTTFCRLCLRIWLSADSNNCGNSGCIGEDAMTFYLRNCPRKKVGHAENSPSVRACPTCGQLIEHIEACNQVKCLCDQEFCFVCLTLKQNQTQCNKCQPAPIQTF